MPSFIDGFQAMKQLKIDATDIKEQSLGKLGLDCASLVSLHLRSVQQGDDEIVISKNCTALTDF